MTDVSSVNAASAPNRALKTQAPSAPKVPNGNPAPSTSASASSAATHDKRAGVFGETAGSNGTHISPREKSNTSLIFGTTAGLTDNKHTVNIKEDGKPKLSFGLSTLAQKAKASLTGGATRADGSGSSGAAQSIDRISTGRPSGEIQQQLQEVVARSGSSAVLAGGDVSSIDDLKQLTRIGDERSFVEKTVLTALDKLLPNFQDTLVDGAKRALAMAREGGVDLKNDAQFLLVIQPAITYKEQGPGGTDIGALDNKFAAQMNLIWNVDDIEKLSDVGNLTIQVLGRHEIYGGFAMPENSPFGGGGILGDEVGYQIDLKNTASDRPVVDIESPAEDVLSDANDPAPAEQAKGFFSNMEVDKFSHFKHTHQRGEVSLPYAGSAQGTVGHEKVFQQNTQITGTAKEKATTMGGLFLKDLTEFAVAAGTSVSMASAGFGVGQSNAAGIVAKAMVRNTVTNNLPPYPTNRDATFNQNHIGLVDNNAVGAAAPLGVFRDGEINAQLNIYPRLQHSTNSPGYRLGEAGRTEITNNLKSMTEHQMVIDAAEDNLDKVTKGMRDLAIHRDVEVASRATLDERKTEVEIELSTLNGPLVEAQENLDAAETKFRDEGAVVSDLKREVRLGQETITGARLAGQQNLADLESTQNEKQIQYETADAKLTELKSEIVDLREQVNVLSADNQGQRETLQQELDGLNSEIKVSDTKLSEFTNIEKKLHSLKGHTETVLDREKKALGEVQLKQVDLEKRNAEFLEERGADSIKDAIAQNPKLEEKLDIRAERGGKIAVDRFESDQARLKRKTD